MIPHLGEKSHRKNRKRNAKEFPCVKANLPGEESGMRALSVRALGVKALGYWVLGIR
jgi:hypothetical protein